MTTPPPTAGPVPDPAATRSWPPDTELLAALEPWLCERRWFPLKGEAAPAPGTVSVLARWDMADGVRDHLLAVPRASATGEPTGPVLLHVPLVLDDAAALSRLAVEGEAEGAVGLLRHAHRPADGALVDGPHHPAFWRAWAQGALTAGTVLGQAGARAIAERAERLRVTTGEQSNTSVILPAPEDAQAGPGTSGGPAPDASDGPVGDLIVKVFRVLAPGRNPDVEVSVALARDGWDRVRRPVAWSTLTWEQPGAGQTGASTVPVTADGGVACTFVPQADDGFELFCSLASTDDGDAGGGGPVRRRALDLAGTLGATTAQMHAHLAHALGTSAPVAPGELAAALRERADWAQAEVPDLARALPGLAAGVERVLTSLAGLDHLPVATRVHGDYHLGQVLHAEDGWYVLDFEGEPLRPLAERSEPDQPLRDVAGMLRSFDYAAAVGGVRDPGWLPAVRAAYLAGYHRETAEDPDSGVEQVLLTALELDKALYEAVYEARNRPDWLAIPLHGVEVALASS